MPPRATHRAPPTINLDLSAAFSRSSDATSRRAAASSCPNPASATPSRAARAPGPPSSSAAASRAATPGLLARYPRIWELSGRTDGPAFPFTRRRTRQRAQKAFRPRPFDDQPTPLTRAVPKIRKTPPTPTATDRGGTVSSSRATHVRYRQIQVGLCCGQRAGASPLLRAGPPASAASVLNASGFCRRQAPSRDPGPPAPSRRINARLLPFRARAADQDHAAFTPGTTWPIIGTPTRFHHRRTAKSPAFDATSIVLTTPQQRTPNQGSSPGRRLLERLPGPHLTRQARLFPDRSPRQSSANAARGGLAPAPEGRRWRANKPPSLAQHRLYEDLPT